MIPIRRILCPVDFSEFSRRALDHASALARQYDSTLTVFNVVPSPGDLRDLLESMKRFADAEAGTTVPMQFEIGEGDAAREILDRARAMPSDLIVMGTHGRSGFERLLSRLDGAATAGRWRSSARPTLQPSRVRSRFL